MKRGDVVYCEFNSQAYVIQGICDGIVYARNLFNLECPQSRIHIESLIPYPKNWKNYDWLCYLASKIIG